MASHRGPRAGPGGDIQETVSIDRSVNMAQTVQKLVTKVPTLVSGECI